MDMQHIGKSMVGALDLLNGMDFFFDIEGSSYGVHCKYNTDAKGEPGWDVWLVLYTHPGVVGTWHSIGGENLGNLRADNAQGAMANLFHHIQSARENARQWTASVQAEDDAATERPEPIPDHEARWTARFPYIDDMGSVAPIHGVQDKGNETKEEEALWHLNDMRKHDGLPPRKSLPKGTTFERTTPRESVLVDFRVFPEGDVIALMPNIPETAGRIMSYMHMGQHSPATPELRVTLRAATPEEYGPLLRELEQVGYAVRVWHDGEEE